MADIPGVAAMICDQSASADRHRADRGRRATLIGPAGSPRPRPCGCVQRRGSRRVGCRARVCAACRRGGLPRGAPVGSREPAPCLLHRRKRGLGLRQRTRSHVDARRLGRDRDLLAGRCVASGALLSGRLDAYRQLDEPSEPDLLGIAQLLEDDLVEGVECPFSVPCSSRRGRRPRRSSGTGSAPRLLLLRIVLPGQRYST
jgi:hypothetical protein